jgi:23S rRNA pseudouridine2605 synthase
MRINKFVAQTSGLSRRGVDQAIIDKRILINEELALIGQNIDPKDVVKLDGKILEMKPSITIVFNKPVGYVCSRDGQGNRTIYELLPQELQNLKTIGRLDKDTSGLLLLTTDGDLAFELTHPKFEKTKIYEAELDRELIKPDQQLISSQGIKLEDGISRLKLKALNNLGTSWQITMSEGRNRQIRRTFSALHYNIKRLRRTNFGDYALDDLREAHWQEIEKNEII